MKAKIKENRCENGKWQDGKEQIAAWAVVAFQKGMFEQAVTVRFWRARKSDGAGPVYCSLWASGGDVYLGGHGTARGWGYHKQSAALQEALSSAGVELFADNGKDRVHIDGHGESAMRDALTALARALGYRKTHIVEL